MKYNFKIHKSITNTIWYYVNFEEDKFHTLNNFTDSNWTPSKIQNIIEGIESSKLKDSDDSFDWQNEDIFFRSNKYGVFFVDLTAQRAGQKSKKQDLTLNQDEFIGFLLDFKDFVQKNN